MGRVFVTGDTHGDFRRIRNFCLQMGTTKKDLMIICGDACLNYYLNYRDDFLKNKVSDMPITFLIVHGNHEERAWNTESYAKVDIDTETLKSTVYRQSDYPNILFVDDFTKAEINGKKVLFLGGAYSVDKYYRLAHFKKWFSSEQMTDDQMEVVLSSLQKDKGPYDYVITHTCPQKYVPMEAFLPWVDQNTVDHRTEEFLDKVEEMIEYENWICGHWHIDKVVGKIQFMFEGFSEVV